MAGYSGANRGAAAATKPAARGRGPAPVAAAAPAASGGGGEKKSTHYVQQFDKDAPEGETNFFVGNGFPFLLKDGTDTGKLRICIRLEDCLIEKDKEGKDVIWATVGKNKNRD